MVIIGENMVEDNWKLQTLHTFFNQPPSSQAWLIPGILPAESLTLLTGQQKRAFKTWLADTLGAIICSGKGWGHLLQPTTRGPVLHIQMEGTPTGNLNRMLAIHEKLQTTEADREQYGYIFRQNVKLDDPLWQKRLETILTELKPVLVILDAMVYLHNADENKVSEVKPVIETISLLRQAGATVLMLAHLNSEGENPKADIDNQVRGRGLWVNAYDCHLALRRYKMSQSSIDLTVRFRDLGAEEYYTVHWDIKSDQENIHDLNLFIGRKGERNNELEHLLAKMMPGEPYSRTELRKQWAISQSRTNEYIKEGLEKGFLTERGTKIEKARHQ